MKQTKLENWQTLWTKANLILWGKFHWFIICAIYALPHPSPSMATKSSWWIRLTIGLTVKNLLQYFTEKNPKKRIKKSLESRKLSREKLINYKLNGRAFNSFNDSFKKWIDKKDILWISEYFPKPISLRESVKLN